MSPLSFVRVASPATSVVACNRGLARARATPDIFFFLCRCSVSLFRTHTHRLPRVWCLPYFWQKKVPEPHPVEGEGPCGSRGPRQEMRCPSCVVKNHLGFFTGWEEDEEEREEKKAKKSCGFTGCCCYCGFVTKVSVHQDELAVSKRQRSAIFNRSSAPHSSLQVHW